MNNPYVVSAQFAAYVWYSHENPDKSNEDASTFARRNWFDFLPCAHKGVGKLLVKINELRKESYKKDGFRIKVGSEKSSPRRHLTMK